MKILLTGATGFVGLNLVNALNKAGHLTLALTRFPDTISYLNELIPSKRIYGSDDRGLFGLFSEHPNIDIIIHAATNYGFGELENKEVLKTNVLLPVQLLEFAKLNKIEKFINISTFYTKIDDSYPHARAYRLSKAQFIEWGKLYLESIQFINLNVYHLYGPGDRSNKFITQIINSCMAGDIIDLTSGEQRRDFIYIQDLVSAIEVFINSKLKKGFHDFDIGSGHQTSIKEIVTLISLLTGGHAKLRWGALKQRTGEPSEMQANLGPIKSLGWVPKTTLADGLQKTIDRMKGATA